MKLIDKDALVAWAKETYLCENASMIRKVCYKQLLEHLDTLDVKEVGVDIGDPKGDKSAKCIIDTKTLEVKEEDLDKLLTGFMSRYAYENGGEYPSAIEIAKHFFELALSLKK